MIRKLFFIIILLLAVINAEAQNNESSPLLSFDFQKIAVRDLLSILAKASQQDFIISDKVQGEMSLHLEKVSWQEALNLILSSQNLASQQQGKVILIAPVAEIAAQQQGKLALLQQQDLDAPLESRVIALHYAKAQDIATMLKDKSNNLLSPRGNIGVDNRTNSIWLEDNQMQLNRVNRLVNKLDVPTPQVEIEARIVTVDTNYERELGVRFGVSGGQHVSGTLVGANALNQGVAANNIALKDRLAFDFPDMATTGASGSLGLALLKLADGYMLDMELAALQAEGAGEIIASPKLMTSNQQSATIQTGEEIPYQEKTSSGATSVAFKKAVLSLHVTPQVTASNKILLNLKISQDNPSSQLINGVPAINTREIETQVLVNNNQTIVLGGIYESSKNNQIERIPFLSDIPLLGKLFEHQYHSAQKRELLIFVRPKTVNS